MRRSYIELLPRDADSLQSEIATINQFKNQFSGINLPELIKPQRNGAPYLSSEAIMKLRQDGKIDPNKELALHLRTQDRSIEETVQRIHQAFNSGVDTALLVSGDTFTEEAPKVCTHDVLQALTEQNLSGNIAVAADLYFPDWGRWSKKVPFIQSGLVNSIFTQPVFDSRIWDELVFGMKDAQVDVHNVFVGITWITNATIRDKLWNITNKVPMSDLPQGESNDTILANSMAQSVQRIRDLRHLKFSEYLMIITGTMQQLEDIFNRAENFTEV